MRLLAHPLFDWAVILRQDLSIAVLTLVEQHLENLAT